MADFQVNSPTISGIPTAGVQTTFSFVTGIQVSSQSIAMADDGRYVVVWTDGEQPNRDVYATLYKADGQIETAFRVNTTTADDQYLPSVAMAGDGSFVVAWTSFGQDSTPFLSDGVYARRFNADGSAASGEFLLATASTANEQIPSLAIDTNGDFWATWTKFGGGSRDVFIRKFSGTTGGSTTQVNSATSGNQYDSSIAIAGNGNFVVTWTEGFTLGSGQEVFARLYAANGTPITEFRVNEITAGEQSVSSVAMDDAGNFVVTWQGGDSSNSGIYARRYKADGTALDATEFLVNTTETGEQLAPSIAMNGTGDFIVSWSSNSGSVDGSGYGIYAQRYSFNLNGSTPLAQGLEFAVNTITDGDQQYSSVIVDAAGKAIAVWTGSQTDDPALTDVFGATIDVAPNQLPSVTSFSVNLNEDTLLPFDGTNGADFITRFTDPDGDSLGSIQITVLPDPAKGKLILNGVDVALNTPIPASELANLKYQPVSNVFGTDSFQWTATDSRGGLATNSATVNLTIAAVDDPPTILIGSGVTNYEEATPDVPVAPGLLLSDPEGSQISQATITITTNFQPTEDILSIDTSAFPGITASPFSGGSITLSGLGTVLQYQTLLSSVKYRNTSDNPNTALRTIVFTATDNTPLISPEASQGVQVIAKNTAPTLTIGTTPLDYTEGQTTPLLINTDAEITITDPDSTQLNGASVTITNFDTSQDVIAFDTALATSLGIQGVITGGSIAFSNLANLSAYRDVLKSITFSNNSPNPNTALRTATFSIKDNEDLFGASQTRDIRINPTNTKPTVTPTADALPYTEQSGAQIIDGAIAVVDPDSQLKLATITINSFDAAQDAPLTVSIPVDLAAIITADPFDTVTGTLTLRGTASAADYQRVLQLVQYTNTSFAPASQRQITFSVTDTTDQVSQPKTRLIQITAIDDPPAVVTTPTDQTYVEESTPVIIDDAIQVTDLDSPLTGATVQITGFDTTQDQLTVTLPGGSPITVAPFNTMTGTLTFSGQATAAEYQAVLRLVQYTNLSNNPATSRTLVFTVTDLTNQTATDDRIIQIQATDTPPTLQVDDIPLNYIGGAGASPIDNTLTVFDPDSPLVEAIISITNFDVAQDAPLTFTPVGNITSSVSGGTLTLSGSGSFGEYQQALRSVVYNNISGNPSGNRTITFQLKDSTGQTATDSRTIQIINTNAPVIQTTGQALVYNEDDAATNIDSGIQITDPNSTQLQGATVEITGFDPLQDEIIFPASQGAINGLQTGNRVVFTGPALISEYIALLTTVQYRNISQNPTGNRKVLFTVTDSSGLISGTAFRDIQIQPIDTPPTLNLASPLNYNELQGLITLDAALTVMDPDSQLVSATIQINGFDPAQDAPLSFTPQTGIGGSFNSATGILTLSGTVDASVYQQVLRSIQYSNTSSNPAASRIIEFTVTDTTNQTTTQQLAIQIVPNNNPPTITLSSPTVNYLEGTGAITLDNQLAITDVDSTSFTGATVTIVGLDVAQDTINFTTPLPTGISGTLIGNVLTFTGSGDLAQYQGILRSITFTNNNANPTGTRSVQFTITDSTNQPSAIATQTITFVANQAPQLTIATGDLTFTEGSDPISIDASLGVTDPDGVTLTGATVTIISYDANQDDPLSFTIPTGSLIQGTFNNGVLTFTGTAPLNEYRQVLQSVQYKNRSDNPTGTRTIQFQVTDIANDLSNVASRNILLGGVPTPPTITLSGSTINYVEGSGAIAIDSLLTVTDPDSTTFTGASITIGGLDAADTLNFATPLPAGISSTLTGNVLTLTGAGTLTQYEDILQSITFANSAVNPTGTRTVDFTITDDSGRTSTAATRTITFTENQAPQITIAPGDLTFTEGSTPLTIDSALGITDPDGQILTGATVTLVGFDSNQDDPLLFTIPVGSIIQGNFDGATGILTFTGTAPLSEYRQLLQSVQYKNRSSDPTGTRTIKFQVKDTANDLSNEVSRIIQISALPTPPTITPSGSGFNYSEGSGAIAIDAALDITDPDSTSFTTATVTIVNYDPAQDIIAFTTPAGLTGIQTGNVITFTGSGNLNQYRSALQSITFANTAANPTGSRTVNFTITDDSGQVSAAATRTITLATNQPPQIAIAPGDLTFTEGGALLTIDAALGITDSDGTTLTGATVTIIGFDTNQDDPLGFTIPTGSLIQGNFASGVLTLTGTAPLTEYQQVLQSVQYTNRSQNPTGSRTIQFQVKDIANDLSNIASRIIQISAVPTAPAITLSGSGFNYIEGSGAIAIDAALDITDPDSINFTGATATIVNYDGAQDTIAFTTPVGLNGSQTGNVITFTGSGSLSQYRSALQSITFSNNTANPSGTRSIQFIITDDTGTNSTIAIRTITFVANQAPQITIAPGDLTFTEGPTPLTIDAALGVSDADGLNLTGATVTIVGFDANQDNPLGFAIPTGSLIQGSFSNGVLTFTGTAPLSEYQQALQSVQYTNRSQNPTGSRTIQFQVKDTVNALSNIASRVVQINGLPTPPTITLSGSGFNYIEGTGTIPIDNLLAIADPDSITFTEATVTIVGFDGAQDVIAFTTPTGLTGTQIGNVVTFSTPGTLDQYQAALQSITFTNTAANPSGTRIIQFTIKDDTGNISAVVTRTITLVDNQPPQIAIASGDLTFNEGATPLLIDDTLGITDTDGVNLTGGTVTIVGFDGNQDDPLSFTIPAGSIIQGSFTNGVLTLTGTAPLSEYQQVLQSVRYNNRSQNPTGSRTIEFQVKDTSNELSNVASRTITIARFNTQPTIAITQTPLPYTEGQGAIALDATGLTVSDPDSPLLNQATITINGFDATQDGPLTFTQQGTIAGNFDPATGTLTLSGDGTPVQYEAVLRSIQYTNISGSPVANRVIQLVVKDVEGASSLPVSRTITITATETDPVVNVLGTALPYTEGSGTIAIDNTLTVIDPDSPLTGATVEITNFDASQDSLSFSTQGTTITGNIIGGKLTLTGSGTPTQYRDVLRSVTYANNSTTPNTTDRIIQIQVTDATNRSSNLATRTLQITPVNSAPTVTLSPSSLPYNEGDGAIAIDNGLTITDIDSTQLSGATVTITNFDPSQETLSFTDQNGITGTINGGQLILSGTASLSNYVLALRSVRYTNTSINPTTTPRLIQFTATDTTNVTSAIASRSIQITTVNNAPTVTTSPNDLTYTEGAGAIAIDPGLTLTDPENDTISGATITITNVDTSQDSLGFVPQNGITGVVNGGTLTLTGTATLKQYEDALKTVTYTNSSISPNTSDRLVQISVTDSGNLSSNLATRRIEVKSVDSIPQVTPSPGAVIYRENAGAVVIDGTVSVSDFDSVLLSSATVTIVGYVPNGKESLAFVDQNSITGSFNPQTGVLNLSGLSALVNYQNALRSVRYVNTSDDPAAIVRTIEFSINDATSNGTATRELQLLPVPDAPIVITSRGVIPYFQNTGAIVLDDGILVKDADSTNLTAATIRLVDYTTGETLGFIDQNGIIGQLDPVTGILSLTGTSSVSQYQTVLRSITYQTSSGAIAPSRFIQFSVNDGGLTSDLTTATLQLVSDNTAPVLDLNGIEAGINFVTTGTANINIPAVDTDLALVDPDTSMLTAAIVEIANYDPTLQERLAVDVQGTPIIAAFNGDVGTLTLTGMATPAQYQQVLRSLTYSTQQVDPTAPIRSLQFSVRDAENNSVGAIATINLGTSSTGVGTGQSLVTTGIRDVINGPNSDDTVTSTLAHLQQNDLINGGLGLDTLRLTDGKGTAVVDVRSTANQLQGIIPAGTAITNFERFDFRGFAGSVTMIGSDLLENRLIGGDGDDILLGGASNDLLSGNRGSDTLDGGTGADSMAGGSGNDLYGVDRLTDGVIEDPNAGTDTIQSAINLTLPANVENLTLIGSATQGTGNTLNNTITGNGFRNILRGDQGNDVLVGGSNRDQLVGGAGKDTLIGGAGIDRVTGGKGKDSFRFNGRREGRDVITDFRPVDDSILISRAGLSRSLRRGRLSTDQFVIGTSAVDRGDRFIYNRTTGALFFDPDGMGGAAQIPIARLTNKALLSAADIIVVV